MSEFAETKLGPYGEMIDADGEVLPREWLIKACPQRGCGFATFTAHPGQRCPVHRTRDLQATIVVQKRALHA